MATTKDKIKKVQEQFIQDVKHPEEFLTKISEKNQAFTKELQSIILELPQEAIAQQKETQEKLVSLGKKVQESVSKQPIDWIELQQAFLQYHTENFATQSKIVQQQGEKIQKLFSIYENSN